MPIPSETNFDQFTTDYVASGHLNIGAWYNVVLSCASIPEAMGYAALPADLRADLFDKFEECETLGYVPELPKIAAATDPDTLTPPRTYEPTLTWAEAKASYVSKVAHAFWLEKNKTFPWRLNQIPMRALKFLFDPNELYTPWSPSAATSSLGYLVDNCPYRMWQLRGTGSGGTMEGFAGTSMRDAVFELHKFAETYKHGTFDDIVNNFFALHADDMESSYNDAGGGKYWSLTGCQSMKRNFAAWCRSINIPASHEESEAFSTSGAPYAHGQVVVYMDGTYYVTTHADDFYNASHRYDATDPGAWRTPRSPHTFFSDADAWANAYAFYGETQAFEDYCAREVAKHIFGGPRAAVDEANVGFIGPWIIDAYESNGWAYVEAIYATTSSAANTNVRNRLIKITGLDIA